MEVNSEATVGHLKSLLNEQIKCETENFTLYRKIYKRLTYISVSLSFMIMIGIASLVYSINKPHSVFNETLEAKRDIDTRMRLHSDFINMNTDSIRRHSYIMNRNIIEIDSLKKLLKYEKAKR